MRGGNRVCVYVCSAEPNRQIEGPFSTLVHMEMRINEVNAVTVTHTTLCIVILMKDTRRETGVLSLLPLIERFLLIAEATSEVF